MPFTSPLLTPPKAFKVRASNGSRSSSNVKEGNLQLRLEGQIWPYMLHSTHSALPTFPKAQLKYLLSLRSGRAGRILVSREGLKPGILQCPPLLTHPLVRKVLGNSGESKVWKHTHTKKEFCQLPLGGGKKEALGLFLCSGEHGGGHFLNPCLKLTAIQKWYSLVNRSLILHVKMLRTSSVYSFQPCC